MNELVSRGTTVHAPSSGRVGRVTAISRREGGSFHDIVSTTRHLRVEEANACTYLREFDSLRRELSTQFSGTPGLGAGYDSLTVRYLPQTHTSDEVQVTFTATVCRSENRRHLVEYVATSASGSPLERTYVELAQGRAWTLHGHGRSAGSDVDQTQR